MRGGAAAFLLLAAAAGLGCASGPAPDPLAAGLRDLRALAARSSPDGDPATVDLLLAPDAAFLEAAGADAIPSLERAVAAADRVLGPETGFRFRVGGAVLLEATPGVRDDLRLLWEARLRLARGRCDAVVAVTGARCGDRAGAAEPALRLLLCADGTDLERNLLHEAAHLFGAKDYRRGHPGYGMPGLMTYDSDQPRSLDLDPANLARVRARRGRLPEARPDPVAAAFAARLPALPGPTGAALLGAFLTAESRSDQREGLAPALRYQEDRPEDPLGPWLEGECRRVLRERDDAGTLLLLALEGIAALPAPDGLDRHAALSMARLAVDGVDGLEALMPAAERALEAVDRAFPRDPEVLDLRGSLRARAGDRRGAERFYDAAIDADPTAVYPWRHLASLGRSVGDAELWLEGWRGALAADPLDLDLARAWLADGEEAFPAVMRRADVAAEAERSRQSLAAAFPAMRR